MNGLRFYIALLNSVEITEIYSFHDFLQKMRENDALSIFEIKNTLYAFSRILFQVRVWQIHDFSAIQILREINLKEDRYSH